jgi:hypothetical protein
MFRPHKTIFKQQILMDSTAQYSFMYLVIVLSFIVLRMSVLFLSSYCVQGTHDHESGTLKGVQRSRNTKTEKEQTISKQ